MRCVLLLGTFLKWLGTNNNRSKTTPSPITLSSFRPRARSPIHVFIFTWANRSRQSMEQQPLLVPPFSSINCLAESRNAPHLKASPRWPSRSISRGGDETATFTRLRDESVGWSAEEMAGAVFTRTMESQADELSSFRVSLRAKEDKSGQASVKSIEKRIGNRRAPSSLFLPYL